MQDMALYLIIQTEVNQLNYYKLLYLNEDSLYFINNWSKLLMILMILKSVNCSTDFKYN